MVERSKGLMVLHKSLLAQIRLMYRWFICHLFIFLVRSKQAYVLHKKEENCELILLNSSQEHKRLRTLFQKARSSHHPPQQLIDEILLPVERRLPLPPVPASRAQAAHARPPSPSRSSRALRGAESDPGPAHVPPPPSPPQGPTPCTLGG